jgi:Ricin-type beta-trefoil lectin domain
MLRRIIFAFPVSLGLVLAALSGLPALAQPELIYKVPAWQFSIDKVSHGELKTIPGGVRIHAITRDPLYASATFRSVKGRIEVTKVIVRFHSEMEGGYLTSLQIKDPQSGIVLDTTTDGPGKPLSGPGISTYTRQIPPTKAPKTIGAEAAIRLQIGSGWPPEGGEVGQPLDLIEVEVFYKNPALKLPTSSTGAVTPSQSSGRGGNPSGAPGGSEWLSMSGSNKCVGTASMGSMENGTRLVIWDCHGNPDQQWKITSETLLKNVSGKCVGTSNMGSMENGTPLVIWDCHGNPDQQWKISETLLKNVSGKCVGTSNMGSMENGTSLVIWDCHGNPDQQWKITSVR